MRTYKVKSVLILIAILITLTGFRMLWLFYHVPKNQPVADAGVLDLRGYTLTDDQPIVLNGGWSFSPESFMEKPRLRHARKQQDSTSQYGTYSLKIIMDDATDLQHLFSIRIPSVKTASALFVNGQLKNQSGEAATNETSHVGKGHPYVVTFPVEGNEIDIMLQVSNFDTSEGVALSGPIKFGTSTAVAKNKNFEDRLLTGLLVILILHSIYSLLIFIFIDRKIIMLFFAIGILFPAMDELLTYNSASMEWLHLNYVGFFKFKELMYLGAALFLVYILKNLLASSQKYKRFRWFMYLYGVSALLIIILPLHLLIQINILFFALYIVSFIGVVSLALKEYFQYKDESFFIAIVMMGMLSGIIWGLMKEATGVIIPFYPFDYICAFLGFAVYWFKRFYRQNQHVVELVGELEQTDKKKDEFLANTSHELRNPLHGVINIAQTILDDKEATLTDRNKENLKLLINIGRRMTATLNDLLDFTRLKEQQIKLNKEKVNIASVTSSVLDMLHFMTDGKDIKFHLNIPDTFPSVEADVHRLIQILFNLLHNAVKYTEHGRITIEATHQNGMATIYIKDTGIGMDQETKEKIFLPYEQEDSSITSIGSGIGLGLSISKQLIELHGGEIFVESTPKEGSTFSFTLQLADISKDETNNLAETAATVSNLMPFGGVGTMDEAEIRPTEGQANRAKILVVDDDVVNLKIIKEMLAFEYDVTTETSGHDALHTLNEGMFDLIITDVMMPNMSGYELTQMIRKQYSISELPILLLTARNESEDIYTGFLSGANDYVSKPMDALELKARVKVLTDLKHSIKEQLSMEAAWLQAQIQPHFLFNVLNTIASLSAIDTDRMIKLLNEFGNYLQKSFDLNTTKTLIPLEAELDLIRSYLYIEKERFGDRLNVTWDVDTSFHLEVPPLSIQPLVENAVVHGVLSQKQGGTICIRIKNYVTYAEVAIIDDGAGIEEEKLKEIWKQIPGKKIGIGLANTDRRLRKLFGKGLSIESAIKEGTTITFEIPMKQTSII